VSDDGREEIARRDGLVWRRRRKGADWMDDLRGFLEDYEQIPPTFDDDLRALLASLRAKVTTETPAAPQKSWLELKRGSSPGSEAWAMANVALHIEEALKSTEQDEKLRLTWNAALEMGKTVAGSALGEKYTLGKRLAPGNKAQRNSGNLRRDPETMPLMKAIDGLLSANPHRTPNWACLQLAAKKLRGKSDAEVKQYAESLRSKYRYHRKKAGEE
jgi:hypothetical protein